MKRFLILILMLVLMALPLGADSIATPHGFAGKLYAGTLALYGTQDGVTKFICTAEPFEKIAGGYHLISAGHCVQLTPEDVQFSVADEIGGKLTPVKMLKAYLGNGIDFSEFELKTTRKYPVFRLGTDSDVRVGDRVINPNFSAGVVKQLSLGFVSSHTIPVSPRCSSEDCAGAFIVQMFGAGGASGSAVVSERTHEVIGLVVWGFDANIGVGIEPISRFAKFMAGPNQPHPAPEPDDSIIIIIQQRHGR